MRVIEDGRPIFQQVAEQIENAIVDGSLPEEAQAPRPPNWPPSTGSIPPPRPGARLPRRRRDPLQEAGYRDVRRHRLGCRLREQRRARFTRQYVEPLLAEARKLGMDADEIATMIRSAQVPA